MPSSSLMLDHVLAHAEQHPDRIYLTQPLYEQRETLARYNLQQELERLKHEELPQIISAR